MPVAIARSVDGATRACAIRFAQPLYAMGRWFGSFWQIRLERAGGFEAIAAARMRRLHALVQFAHQRSPLFRELYRDIPDGHADLRDLPATSKMQLMSQFDDWMTDRAITRARVEAFLADRQRIGERFDGRFVVWKSSGTTGHEGIFVQDDAALAIYDALLAVQLAAPDLAFRAMIGSILRGGRAALIAATGDHFASIASWERVCRANPGLDARGFSVMEPLPSLVAELNRYQPAYLASYPTMLLLLAEEQRSRRLRIRPTLVWSGGEYLGGRACAALERAFGCRVMNEYGASECLTIAFACSEQWLHVNDDWAIVEAVDADHRPVRAGEPSHTALITNLANRVQPVIRYDIGDSIVVHPGVCACGNPMTAIRVEGRRDDVVVLPGDGKDVRVPPMALTTVVEEATDVHRFQIVQRGRDRLMVRLGIDGEVQRHHKFAAAAKALRRFLESQGVRSVQLLSDATPPQPDARSGKLQQVIVERGAQDAHANVERQIGVG